jgi:glutaredoxin
MGWLRKWFGRATTVDQTRPPARVVVYSRTGCHLCDDAVQLLVERKRRYLFTLEVVDVDRDPEVAARYGNRVPVVAIDGRERFWGQVNPALLDRAFRHQAGRATS